jgi:hypothetical protein
VTSRSNTGMVALGVWAREKEDVSVAAGARAREKEGGASAAGARAREKEGGASAAGARAREKEGSAWLSKSKLGYEWSAKGTYSPEALSKTLVVPLGDVM